jgi:hypothetical protein
MPMLQGGKQITYNILVMIEQHNKQYSNFTIGTTKFVLASTLTKYTTDFH